MIGFDGFGLGCYGLSSGIVSSVAVLACVPCWYWVCWCLLSGIWHLVLCGVVWLRVLISINSITIQSIILVKKTLQDQNQVMLDSNPWSHNRSECHTKQATRRLQSQLSTTYYRHKKNRLEANLDGWWGFGYLVGASLSPTVSINN